ncbi:hypothetical protein QWJ26_17540 [Streptomyces sp. CSDS2]|uniref:hypothetical protein n=1 Tax=Streptomyces sp. CSDS2 TaxID=3055051 RepID=UPI0025B0BCE4|nr:hypothetical protein [Streptomyces sp. CSDS2]MDN3261584.1 hypothetical protein [Streptomyces sp. CSDS2]
MEFRKTLALTTATLTLGSGLALASGTAMADTAPAASVKEVSARAGWHTIWGNTWVPAQRSGKWTSGKYRSPSKTTRAVLRCYNSRASMRVRLFEQKGGHWKQIASSGYKRCNPNGGMIAKGKVSNTRHWLKVRIDGRQGSFVRAEKWS